MEFITILIAIAVEQYYKTVEQYRQFDWFASYCDWMQQKSASFAAIFPSASGTITLIIILTPIVLVAAFTLNALASMGSVFSFIFGIALLIYSFGPRDLNAQVDEYKSSLSSGDAEGALYHANNLFSGHHYQPEFGGTPLEIIELVKRGILLAFNNRILAVLFWFLVLGPVGALLYRLSSLLVERFAGGSFGMQFSVDNDTNEQTDLKLAIQRLYMILGWLPARICALTYALAGSFSDTLLCWRCASDFFSENNEELIVTSGLKALKMPTETQDDNSSEVAVDNADIDISGIEQVAALVKWSLVIVVTVIALMSIVGWIY